MAASCQQTTVQPLFHRTVLSFRTTSSRKFLHSTSNIFWSLQNIIQPTTRKGNRGKVITRGRAHVSNLAMECLKSDTQTHSPSGQEMEVPLIALLACLEEGNLQAESVPFAHFRYTIRLKKKKNGCGISMSPFTPQPAAPTVTEKGTLSQSASFPDRMDRYMVVFSATLYDTTQAPVSSSLLTKMDASTSSFVTGRTCRRYPRLHGTESTASM